MSTPAELSLDPKPIRVAAWRVVEAQHRISTMRIVGNLAEQAVLEQLIEEAKPKIPPACAGLHWLLATPFRYAPYPEGSRFRRARQRDGAFYASEHVETALAETAFYRLLFFAASPGTVLPTIPADLSAFEVAVASKRAIDLTEPPLDAHEAWWTDLINYTPCQDLADQARREDIEVIRSQSVRDPERRRNITVLAAAAFADTKPLSAGQTWKILIRRDGVQVTLDGGERSLEFSISDFAADSRLARLLTH